MSSECNAGMLEFTAFCLIWEFLSRMPTLKWRICLRRRTCYCFESRARPRDPPYHWTVERTVLAEVFSQVPIRLEKQKTCHYSSNSTVVFILACIWSMDDADIFAAQQSVVLHPGLQALMDFVHRCSKQWRKFSAELRVTFFDMSDNGTCNCSVWNPESKYLWCKMLTFPPEVHFTSS